MAVRGILSILDDLATLMDDAAIMARTATAAKKTAGIIGDDLAVNTEAVIGINPKRELAIVWEIAKGSALNKVFLVPAALGLSAFAPAAITPLLMAGGAFLCYEAVHKVMHKKDHKDEEHHKKLTEAIIDSEESLVKLEKKKINQAIVTDFILSAEIIIVSLGTVATAALGTQAAVLGLIAAGTTVGVYGLVGGLVKLDDMGLQMMKAEGKGVGAELSRSIGDFIVDNTPKLMKGLSVIGTTAMFMVGGSILLHGVPAAYHAVEGLIHAAPTLPLLQPLLTIGVELAIGAVAGLAAVGLWDKGLQKPAVAVAKEIAKPFKEIGSLFGKDKKKQAEPEIGKPAPGQEEKAAEALAEALADVPKIREDLAKAAVKTEVKNPALPANDEPKAEDTAPKALKP